MLYTQCDIDFSKLTAIEFENLCYELVVGAGYQNVVWNRGGADGGRDIEGHLPFASPFTNLHYTSWFFECKHYSSGVPPESLMSKFGWADAEQPDFFVVFVSSYLTKGAKEWIRKIQITKRYKVIVVEGEELKNRLVGMQQIIPRYFAMDKYMTLYQDMVRHKSLYNLTPTIEMLMEVICNINHDRFEIFDIGFLLESYYKKIQEGYHEDIGWTDWTTQVRELPKRLFERFRKISTQTDLTPFLLDYDLFDCHGFLSFDLDTDEIDLMDFHQMYIIRNFSNRDEWDKAVYILIINNKKEAFELLISKEVRSYYYGNYNEEILDNILIKFASKDEIKKVKASNFAIL